MKSGLSQLITQERSLSVINFDNPHFQSLF